MVSLFFKHIKLIITWGILLGVAALLVSLFLPRYYSATSQVLIVSRGQSGVDPYTQAKSAERVGENLSQIVGTTDFFEKVMASSIGFKKARFQNLNDRDARKQWQKDVSANMVYNTGLMNITVYSDSKEDAIALSKAVTDVMVSRGWEYVGGDVALKAVNNPLAALLPARPHYIFNMLAGFVLGVLFAGFWVSRAHGTVNYGRTL